MQKSSSTNQVEQFSSKKAIYERINHRFLAAPQLAFRSLTIHWMFKRLMMLVLQRAMVQKPRELLLENILQHAMRLKLKCREIFWDYQLVSDTHLLVIVDTISILSGLMLLREKCAGYLIKLCAEHNNRQWEQEQFWSGAGLNRLHNMN